MALLYHIAHYLSSDFVRLIQRNTGGGRRSAYQRAGKRGRERSLHYSSGGFGILAGETAAIWEGIAERRRMWGWCGKSGWRGETTCGKRRKCRRRKYGKCPPRRHSAEMSHRMTARGQAARRAAWTMCPDCCHRPMPKYRKKLSPPSPCWGLPRPPRKRWWQASCRKTPPPLWSK